MKLDPKKNYLMPLIRGAVFDQGTTPGLVYKEVQMLACQHETDYDSARALIPDCYSPTEEPIVTASFGYYNGVDFMAGGDARASILNCSVDSGHIVPLNLETSTQFFSCAKTTLDIENKRKQENRERKIKFYPPVLLFQFLYSSVITFWTAETFTVWALLGNLIAINFQLLHSSIITLRTTSTHT